MQSLYNVIKNNSVLKQGSKEIVTEFNINVCEKDIITKGISLDNYDSLAKSMLENARRQSEEVKSKAFEEAQRIQEEACVKGYKQGYENGYREGQEQGYKEVVESSMQQAEAAIINAENLLESARKEYERYLESKKEDIKELAIYIAEKILKQQVTRTDLLEDMIYNEISAEKNANTFIVKTNSNYCEQLRGQISLWKEKSVFSGDIFVVEDNSVQPGDAVIEKNNGKIVVGIGTGLEKIREVLEGND